MSMSGLSFRMEAQMGGELYLRTQGQMSPGQPLAITTKVLQSSFECIDSFQVSCSLYQSFKIQVQKSEEGEFSWQITESIVR